jgi:hypothetical protein
MTPVDTRQWVHDEVAKVLPCGVTIRDGKKVVD